jgi:hypothetical protein
VLQKTDVRILIVGQWNEQLQDSEPTKRESRISWVDVLGNVQCYVQVIINNEQSKITVNVL